MATRTDRPNKRPSEPAADPRAKRAGREELIEALNEDLAREYQAVIAYVTYSQVLKGAAYMQIAAELTRHAKQELDHALIIAKQIDYLGGEPTVVPKEVKTSDDAKTMLRFGLENEASTIRNYRNRSCNARRWASTRWRSTSGRSFEPSRST